MVDSHAMLSNAGAMNPMQTSVFVTAVLTVLFCRPFQGQLSLTVVLVALVAALALVVGAWCAPAAGKLFARTGDAIWRRAKNAQLVGGGAAGYLALLLLTDKPGVAAIWGIVAALGIGFLMPGRTGGATLE